MIAKLEDRFLDIWSKYFICHKVDSCLDDKKSAPKQKKKSSLSHMHIFVTGMCIAF